MAVSEHSAFVILAALALSACVAHQPTLLRGMEGIVPGKDTAGLQPAAAREKILSETARIAVDHGYRYFILLPDTAGALARGQSPSGVSNPTIRPGTPVRFRLIKAGEARTGNQPKLDAYALLRMRAPDRKSSP